MAGEKKHVTFIAEQNEVYAITKQESVEAGEAPSLLLMECVDSRQARAVAAALNMEVDGPRRG